MNRTAYIVKGYRTAVGKAPRGVFRFKRPDELAAETIQFMMDKLPEFDKKRIDDVIVGNAMPEAEQGLECWALYLSYGIKDRGRARDDREPLLCFRIGDYSDRHIKDPKWNG